MLRVLSALQKTRGILMIFKKNGLRVLSALRKTRGISMLFTKKGAARVECLAWFRSRGPSLGNLTSRHQYPQVLARLKEKTR
jgi:hypothetical protein